MMPYHPENFTTLKTTILPQKKTKPQLDYIDIHVIKMDQIHLLG